MTGCRKLDKWLVVLVALHGIIACGGFFSPYDPVEQDRDHAYARPMRLHLVDGQGNIHVRPFFYPLRPSEGSVDRYDEDIGSPVSLRFFTSGASYKLLG